MNQSALGETMPAEADSQSSNLGASNVQPVVLVVDDQQANVRMVGALLARAGYKVLPALSGAEGLETGDRPRR